MTGKDVIIEGSALYLGTKALRNMLIKNNWLGKHLFCTSLNYFDLEIIIYEICTVSLSTIFHISQ